MARIVTAVLDALRENRRDDRRLPGFDPHGARYRRD